MKTNELITKIRSVVHCVAPPAQELLEQAADALEECRMKWIPVTERLPESDSQVLAIVSGRWRNITHSIIPMSWPAGVRMEVGLLTHGRSSGILILPTGCPCQSRRRRNQHD